MILGIDHIAWSATDSDVQDNWLIDNGYERIGSHKDIRNDVVKKPYLQSYQETHGIFRYHAPTGIDVELTVHGSTFGPNNARFEYSNDLVILSTNEPEEELRFLSEGLRFRPIGRNRVEMASPIPSWSCIVQVHNMVTNSDSMLDSPGFPCLALLCNSLEDDCERTVVAGATDISNIISLDLGERSVRAVLLRSPTGAIFELVEIATQRSGYASDH